MGPDAVHMQSIVATGLAINIMRVYAGNDIENGDYSGAAVLMSDSNEPTIRRISDEGFRNANPLRFFPPDSADYATRLEVPTGEKRPQVQGLVPSAAR